MKRRDLRKRRQKREKGAASVTVELCADTGDIQDLVANDPNTETISAQLIESCESFVDLSTGKSVSAAKMEPALDVICGRDQSKSVHVIFTESREAYRRLIR